MKIKFCGIRRLEDVAFCNELQPEYLGMILSSGFRRTISPETAEQLVKAKSRSIAAVGVFVNETPEHIAQVLKQVPRSKTGTSVSAGWRTDTGECGRSRSQGTAGRRGLFQRHRNRQCKRLCKNEANCNDNTRCITWAR